MKLENSQKCYFDSSISLRLYSCSSTACHVLFWLDFPCSNYPLTAALDAFLRVLTHLILPDCELVAIHSELRCPSSFWFVLSSNGSRQAFRSANRSRSISNHMVYVLILESQVWYRN